MDSGLLGTLLSVYRPSFLWMPEGRAGEFPQFQVRLSLEGYALLETGEEDPQCH